MIKALLKDVRAEAATRGISTPAMQRHDVIQALYDARYTGSIRMEFKDGLIAAVNIPSDIRIRVE